LFDYIPAEDISLTWIFLDKLYFLWLDSASEIKFQPCHTQESLPHILTYSFFIFFHISFDIIFAVSKGGMNPKRKRNHICPVTYFLTLSISSLIKI